jgi:hypothetical protein
MLAAVEVKRLAKARLQDAITLHVAGRHDGAVYLCGYSVELALKARICRTLKWSGFPETNKEFENLRSFKVHDLDVLLRFTGREAVVKTTLFPDWSVVSAWNPESRYKPIGSVSPADAGQMLASAAVLLRKL